MSVRVQRMRSPTARRRSSRHYASVAGAVALHAGWTSASANRVLMALGAAVFAVRVVGDFRSCGLFKRSAADRFARLDTRLYVPLCFALSTGCLVLAVA